VRADQGGDGVVDIGDAIGRFGRSLVTADGGLARQVARHRFDDRARRQGGARVVEVEHVGNTGRVRSEQRHVDGHLLAPSGGRDARQFMIGFAGRGFVVALPNIRHIQPIVTAGCKRRVRPNSQPQNMPIGSG
jgi:hypothetical protein